MSDVVLERIRKLLALAAGSPFDEEARTAALHAARLIQREGLEIVRPRASPTADATRRTPRKTGRCCVVCHRPIVRGVHATVRSYSGVIHVECAVIDSLGQKFGLW